MRKLVYYVACSLDGFIAHHDGSHDGFSDDRDYMADLIATFPETFPGHFRDVLGIGADNQWFDVVLMGRKTYEVGLSAGVTSPYPHLKQYLFSHQMTERPDEQVELVSENAIALVQQLKQEAGKDIWLCGGGNLAASLLAEHLIDQLILKVNPFVMGSGIPLFAGTIQSTQMTLTEQRTYDNGVIRSHYTVSKD